MKRGQKAFDPYRRGDMQTERPIFAHAQLLTQTAEQIAEGERELQALRDQVMGECGRLRALLDSHSSYRAITRGN